jgi:hypothetical protein
LNLKSSSLLMALLFCAEARCEINGPTILNNNCNLDLGGAYIGVAEGMTSLGSNPAGVAFRPERSTTPFDWDRTAGASNLQSNDFDNNGQSPPDYKSHRIRSLGLMAQYGLQPVGTEDTVSARIGSELEGMPGRLRLRLGTYYEPSNYQDVAPRTHLTGGFEVRMFHTSLFGEYDWALTGTVDSARDYFNVLVALGFWYF